MDFADSYRHVEVIGWDLSPIQPEWVPSNVRFEVENAERLWTDRKKYDFIRWRYMKGSIYNWPQLIAQAYQHLKPGGFVEFQEIGDIYPSDGSTVLTGALLQLMCARSAFHESVGCTLDVAPHLKQWAEDAQFEDVRQKRISLPLGTWMEDCCLGDIGHIACEAFLEGLESFTIPLAKRYGWSSMETQRLHDEVREQLKARATQLKFDIYIVFGQRKAS